MLFILQIHCRRLGGYLAKVNHKHENDWLKNTGRQMAKKYGGSDFPYVLIQACMQNL